MQHLVTRLTVILVLVFPAGAIWLMYVTVASRADAPLTVIRTLVIAVLHHSPFPHEVGLTLADITKWSRCSGKWNLPMTNRGLFLYDFMLTVSMPAGIYLG
jgi:hypothetical protein